MDDIVYDDYKPIVVVVNYECGGIKQAYHTEMPFDADAMDWLGWFRTLLLMLKFHPDTVDDIAPIEEKEEKEEKTRKRRDDDDED